MPEGANSLFDFHFEQTNEPTRNLTVSLVLLLLAVVVDVVIVVIAAGGGETWFSPSYLQPGNGGLVKEGKEVTFLSVFAGIAGILRETRPTLNVFNLVVPKKHSGLGGGVIKYLAFWGGHLVVLLVAINVTR